MLCELRVENLLLIEQATLRLAPGLNVITGETGAGKTVLAHALDLLLGGRPRAGIVRPGAAEAYVEGVFELTDGLHQRLAERLPADAQELVLARTVSAQGRTRAQLNGRTVSAGELGEIATELLAFYGQHEHRRLTVASAQLEILDRFCGAEQARRRAQHAAAHARVRALAGELDELRTRLGARERELDLLAFEIAEIEALAPSQAEEVELLAERGRLRNLEGLRAAAVGAAEALSPQGDSLGEGVLAALAEVERLLAGAQQLDPTLAALAERQRAAHYELEDVAAELRRYVESVEAAPGRLEEVEERLAALDRLKRKHGGSIAAVLEHAQACRQRHAELAGAEEALTQLSQTLERALAERDALAQQLRAARSAAADQLAEAVRACLSELAMEEATFAIALEPRAEPGASGADQVEFLIAPNPGVPAGPLRDVGSGGELSRVMLALLSVAHEHAARAAPAARPPDPDRQPATASARGRPARSPLAAEHPAAPLLVFDEVDAGIGGHTARAVGERLRALASGRQVLCITHLPQVAALAERHFQITKDTSTAPARTTVCELAGEHVVGELVRMLGADDADRAARRHARELLRAA